MSADLLFQIVNTSVLPAWLLLVFAPGWRWTQAAVFGTAIPLLSVVYVAVLVSIFAMTETPQVPDFSSLSGVSALLGDPYGLVAGWTHYLAFDLFVGAWIALDSRRVGLYRLAIVIPLFFTLMAGPLGLLMYLALRQARLKRLLPEPLEAASS